MEWYGACSKAVKFAITLTANYLFVIFSRRISRSRSGIGKLQRMPSISKPEEAETVKG